MFIFLADYSCFNQAIILLFVLFYSLFLIFLHHYSFATFSFCKLILSSFSYYYYNYYNYDASFYTSYFFFVKSVYFFLFSFFTCILLSWKFTFLPQLISCSSHFFLFQFHKVPIFLADLWRQQLRQELQHDPPVGGLRQVGQHPGHNRWRGYDLRAHGFNFISAIAHLVSLFSEVGLVEWEREKEWEHPGSFDFLFPVHTSPV